MAEKVLPSELRLADVVRIDNDAFSDAIVKNVDEQLVHLERPYMAHADFAYVGGVLVYIGHEQFSIPRSDTRHVTRVRRGPTLR